MKVIRVTTIKNIDIEEASTDVNENWSTTNIPTQLNHLANCYTNTLHQILQRHAATSVRDTTIHPDTP